MKLIKTALFFSALCIYLTSCTQQTANTPATKQPVTFATPATPDETLSLLKAGNQRLLSDSLLHTNYREQIAATKDAQHPHSMVLCCMDSRVAPEIIFDQGIGNLFVCRVAGNIEDTDILGSMEYAASKGVKLIVVMGHTHCGAVTGAISGGGIFPGNLTKLLSKISPAKTGDTADKEKMIDASARNNVKMTIADIIKNSKALNDLVNEKKLRIVGAYYDIGTGRVEFIE
jgi:carbonic anhydrase